MSQSTDIKYAWWNTNFEKPPFNTIPECYLVEDNNYITAPTAAFIADLDNDYFTRERPAKEQEIRLLFSMLETRGTDLSMPETKALTEMYLWELEILGGTAGKPRTDDERDIELMIEIIEIRNLGITMHEAPELFVVMKRVLFGQPS